MAQRLPILLNKKPCYDIVFSQNFDDLWLDLEELGIANRRVMIVTDSNVRSLYAEGLLEALQGKCLKACMFSFEAGEEHKTLDTVKEAYKVLIEEGFDRKDLLLAVGGGVVGDVTGYIAATYLRGVDYVQIPTTLLAQADSSIGGKTGVDFDGYKNMVGAFYMPKMVYMNLSVLESLPREQLVSGFGEILKHGLIKDIAYFEWMREHYNEVWMLKYDILEEMIYGSCKIKRGVVERDPMEKGERALLNFGHTIGHAIEKLSDFELSHGTCVGIGIVAASYLSKIQGNITDKEFAMIEQTLAQFGLKTSVEWMDAKEVLAVTKSDKKMVGSKVKFILLETIGKAYIYKELTDEQILEGISYVLES